jgi:hypothetical protein
MGIMPRVISNSLYGMLLEQYKLAERISKTVEEKQVCRIIIKMLEGSPVFKVGMRVRD